MIDSIHSIILDRSKGKETYKSCTLTVYLVSCIVTAKLLCLKTRLTSAHFVVVYFLLPVGLFIKHYKFITRHITIMYIQR